MTILGTYSTDLVTALGALTGYQWFEGSPPDVAPPASTAVGYVWVEASDVVETDQLIMTMTAGVRVYPVEAERLDAEFPLDPTPLYQAVDDVQGVLSPVQAPAGGSPWFFAVTAVAVDHAAQSVEFTVVSHGMNEFAVS